MLKQILQKLLIAIDMNPRKLMSLFLLFAILSCNRGIIPKDDNSYFFYFKNNDSTMQSYFNVQKKVKSRWFEIERAANIVFIEKIDNVSKIKKIKVKDTFGLGVKSYDWLNRFDNSSRERFFNLKPMKRFFIIEKDSSSNLLSLIEVEFVDEID
jgi:hypothetical protein